MKDTLTCRLFIDYEGDKVSFMKKVEKWADGKQILPSLIDSDMYEVDIDCNDEYDCQLKKQSKDGFLFYKYSIFIESKKNIDDDAYKEAILNVIRNIRADGCLVVPACSFEDYLNKDIRE